MGWLVQATDYRKWNEPPRPRLQRNGTIYLMARPPLLCQGVSRAVLLASAKTHKKLRPRKQRTYRRSSLRGEFAFPAGCPRRPCPADDLWVMISLQEGAAALNKCNATSRNWRGWGGLWSGAGGPPPAAPSLEFSAPMRPLLRALQTQSVRHRG